MFRKEYREARSRFLECALVVSAVPATWLAARLFFGADWPFASSLKIALIALAHGYAVYAGLTLFAAEKRDRAFEYLFSLPLSRGRILAAKVLPRLLILAGICAALFLAGGVRFGAESGFADDAWGLRVLVLFFASVSLSLVVESVLTGLFGAMILSVVFHQLVTTMNRLLSCLFPASSALSGRTIGFAAAVLLFFVPLGAAFWLLFRDMDAKPMRFQRRTFNAIVLSMLAVHLALFFTHFAVVVRSGDHGSWPGPQVQPPSEMGVMTAKPNSGLGLEADQMTSTCRIVIAFIPRPAF